MGVRKKVALMGDKVDNVPGIKSCGPKTAAKWINEIGGIDAIRAAAPTMKGKIGENLRAGLPFIDEAVALVTIKRDAVISGAETLADIKAVPAEESALEAFCARWEISRRTLDRAQALAAMWARRGWAFRSSMPCAVFTVCGPNMRI